ncbi:MAG: SpoIIE family protein phosphatase [Lachnospiraceae bacterium]
MKKRQILCYGASLGLTAANVMGCNPFLPGVVAIFGSENLSKPLLAAAVFVGCACFMPYLMAIKYMMICCLILIGEVLVKRSYGRMCISKTAILAASCTFLMGLAGEAFSLSTYGVLVISLEAAFTFGMVLTFKRLIHRMLLEKRKLLKASELPEQEKSFRLHNYAQALTKLADSFGTRQVAYVSPREVGRHEENHALAKGLYAIAQTIEECNTQPVYQCLDREEDIRQLEYRLSEIGVHSSQYALYEDAFGHHSLNFLAKSVKQPAITVKTVAKTASEIFGLTFVPEQKNAFLVSAAGQPISLKESGQFQVRFQVAQESKDEGKVCGDNFSAIRGSEGRTILALSDGMGCGQTACSQSKTVLELIEELIGAGFHPKDALPMMNGCLSSTCSDGFLATLDLCDIDEFTGMATFYKMGAPMSFIIRKNQVEKVESPSLPAGAFWSAQVIPVEKKLYDEDYVIMFSDGVLDSLGRQEPEETMRRLLELLPRGNPAAMAEQILRSVKELGGQWKDDCMVLVAGIWKR